MFIRVWMLLLAACLTLLMAKAHPSRNNGVDLLDRRELASIFSRIGQPFLEVRNRRNTDLEHDLSSADSLSKTLIAELSTLRSLFSDLKGNLPCVEQDLRSLVGSQKSLSSVIEKLSALIHVCGSELHIQTLFQDDVRQVYHRECPIGDGPVLGSGPKNVLFEYQEAIEDSVSCDRQCQEVAITPANMEKHATISDIAAVFSSVVSYQVEVHRRRYLEIKKQVVAAINAGVSVAGGSFSLQPWETDSLLKELKGLMETTANNSLAYDLSTFKLQQLVNNLSC